MTDQYRIDGTAVISKFMENLVSIQTLPIGVTFGVGLDSYMVRQRSKIKCLNIPWVVKKCSDQILLRGLDTVGIFRVPGRHSQIEEISMSFEKGVSLDLSEYSMETVGSIWKKYLRSLPQPLLDDDTPNAKLQNRFKDAMDLETEEEIIDVLKGLVSELTVFRAGVIAEMFFVLHHVSLQSEVNMMDSVNLATIFGGMVDVLISEDVMSSGKKSELCQIMIEHYPEIIESNQILPPCLETPTSSSPTGGQVYVMEGTYISKIMKDTDTCQSVLQYTIDKIQRVNPEMNFASCFLYEVNDRLWRMIGLDEYIFPIMKRGSVILFTNEIDHDKTNNIEIKLNRYQKTPRYIEPEKTDETAKRTVKPLSRGVSLDSPKVKKDERSPREKSGKKTKKSSRSKTMKSTIGIAEDSEFIKYFILHEQLHLNYLSRMIDEYLIPLEESTLLKKKSIDNLFGHFRSFFRIHRDILETTKKTKKIITVVGDRGKELSELYLDYFNTRRKRVKLLKSAMKNHEINKFFKKRDKQSSLGFSITELFKIPFLYIKRYISIFEEIHHFSVSVEDSAELYETLLYTDFDHFTTKRLGDELGLLDQLQNEFIQAIPFDLTFSTRRLIRTEDVDILREKRKISGTLFLFNDIIIFSKTEKKKSIFEFFLPISGITYGSETDKKGKTAATFQYNGTISVYFSEETTLDWELDIREQINFWNKNNERMTVFDHGKKPATIEAIRGDDIDDVSQSDSIDSKTPRKTRLSSLKFNKELPPEEIEYDPVSED